MSGEEKELVVPGFDDTRTAEDAEKDLLTEIGNAITNHSRFEFIGTADEVLNRLDAIQKLDTIYEGKESFWKTWMAVCGILSFVTLMVTVVTFGLALPVLLVAVVLFLIGWTKWDSVSRRNVPNRRYQIPRGLLAYLKTDIPSDRLVRIMIDFRHHERGSFQEGDEVGGFFSSVRVKNFKVPWLELSGQFYDGSKFRFNIVQSVKQKTKQKRKSKKITETFRDRYRLAVAVKPDHYPGIEKFPALIGAVPVPQELEGLQGRVAGNRVFVQGATGAQKVVSINSSKRDPLPYRGSDTALQIFLACYDALGRCRTPGQEAGHV